jgi:hypothetical protein
MHTQDKSKRQRTPFPFIPSSHEVSQVNVLWGGHDCPSVSHPKPFRRNLRLWGGGGFRFGPYCSSITSLNV